MKKSEFYLRLETGFCKVNGYIDTIVDNAGNKHIIGLHRWHKKGRWVATHVESGCSITYGATRKECFENIKEILGPFISSIKTKQVKEYIEQMNNFLSTGSCV